MLAKLRAAWKRYQAKRYERLVDKAIVEADEQHAATRDFPRLDRGATSGSGPGTPPGGGGGAGGG